MSHARGPEVAENLEHAVAIPNTRFVARHVERDVFSPSGGKVVKRAERPAPLLESPDKMAADESGPAGDKSAQGCKMLPNLP